MRLAIHCFLSLVVAAGASAASADDSSPPVAETVPEHLAYLYTVASDTDDALHQLYAEKRTWQAGDTLKVCFFGGNPVVKKLIAEVAAEWAAHAAIKLDFREASGWRSCTDARAGFSKIRIGFGERGYWSAVGTDSVDLLNIHQPSMNLQRFDFRYGPNQAIGDVLLNEENVVGLSALRDRGTILHEFGHALGLLHEHQNPTLDCNKEIIWSGEGNVYDYYARPPNEWTPEKVDRNLAAVKLTDPDYKAGDADPDSIMMYSQPAAILKKGKDSHCYVAEKNVLSSKDKLLIAKIYPKSATPVSDSSFTTAPGRATPVQLPASPLRTEDLLARIRTDLVSTEPSVRREARRQLALELENGDAELMTRLVGEAAAGKSYREQLGVLVAIDKAKSLPRLGKDQQSSVQAAMKSIAEGVDDPTLRQSVRDARQKLDKR